MSKKQHEQQQSAESTAVAATASTAVASPMNFEEDAGAGFERATAESFAIPFLQILQSMSPQCKKSDGAYVKGAEEGMFFNTVTQELYAGDTGIDVVPCYYKPCWLEWAPRDSGGGFRGEHAYSDPIAKTTKRDDMNHDVLPNGNWLVDTRVHYLLVLKSDGTFEPAVISLSSTQVKKSKQWMSLMEGIKERNAAGALFTPPMFSQVYHLTTVPESNDKGSWFGLKVVRKGSITSAALYAAAKEFKRRISAGEVREQMPTSEAGEKDIPF